MTKRKLMIGLLGLTLSGCSQGFKIRQAPRHEPLGVHPVPNLSETINRGTGDRTIRQAALGDPDDPHWSGTFMPPNPSHAPSQAVAAAETTPSPLPEEIGQGANQTAEPLSRSAPGQTETPPVDPYVTDAEIQEPPPQAELREPIADGPQDELPPLPRQRKPVSPEQEETALPPIQDAEPGMSPEPLPSIDEEPAASAAQGAIEPDAEPVRPASSPSRDPLLGPNPGLMPDLPAPASDLPMPAASEPPAAVEAPAPAPANEPAMDIEATPAASEAKPDHSALDVEDAPAVETAPSSPVPETTGMTLEAAPESAGEPQPEVASAKSIPTLTPVPIEQPAPIPVAVAREGNGLTDARPAAKVDPQVANVSYDPGADQTAWKPDREWQQAGKAAARVGDEVITLHELVVTVKETLKRNPMGRSPTKDELNLVAKSVLAGLIERTLIAQEAKRVLKNPKQLEHLYNAADKYWREEELPTMLRKSMVENEAQLRTKLAETDTSLDAIRKNWRQDFLVQVYLEQKFSNRRKVELPEMLKFYNEHLSDKTFDRPAQVTWRELIVEKSKHATPEEARSKADSFVARLARGEDFAAIARAESEGPSLVRAAGGLMETVPGCSAVPAVNEAIDHLPLGQVSSVLEGPTSFHVVKIEKRRHAGPATFEEVQGQIREAILSEKMYKLRKQFIENLRRNTPVTTIFDGTESDPNTLKDR